MLNHEKKKDTNYEMANVMFYPLMQQCEVPQGNWDGFWCQIHIICKIPTINERISNHIEKYR